MKQVFYKLFVNCLYCNNYIDPSLLLVVKKFDRCRISTKIEQEGQKLKNLSFHLLENTDLHRKTISLRFDRHISSQDSFGHRLSLFSKPLCLGIVHKGERISSLFSLAEKGECNRILESIIRDYTPEIVHRDEIHVRR